MRRRVLALVVAAVAVVGLTVACDTAPKVFAKGSTGQILVYTDPHAKVELFDSVGRLVPMVVLDDTGHTSQVWQRTTDDEGYLVIRYVKPGTGYRVGRADDTTVQDSDPVDVTTLQHRPPASYFSGQHLTDGFQYLATRDGTLLSAMVRLPGPPDKGPYPTVIEYSGYDPSNPAFSPVAASSYIANLLGFATVGVNIRGTGCSGGSFQLWEDTQATDGYDVVETVAAQPWVLGHKVGMVGISYPATAQLYTAETQPPSLEAIAPMATYDDGFRQLLRPGGIVNDGFATQWLAGRYQEAQPAGQAWAAQRIADGDKICAQNQNLRGQNLDLTKLIDVRPYYPTELGLGDSLAPVTFADKVQVPTFLVASFQDEQVGGHAPTLIPHLTGTAKKKITLVNGYHTEGLASPDIIQRWWEFLEFYVAHRVPDSTTLRALHPTIANQILHSDTSLPGFQIPADRFTGMSYAAALAKYEAEPAVRVLFENGASSKVPAGYPLSDFEADFSTYPVPKTTPTTLYFGDGGSLTPTAPTAADDSSGTVDSYVSDPSVRPKRSLEGDAWVPQPNYDWTPAVDANSRSYLSAPMAADTVMVGSASVDLWLRSSAADTDLQATLTEVRPDGKESFVQSGVLRASVRKVDEATSTALQPLPTMLESDAAPLPAGQFSKVRVEVYPFAHAFRAGSRLRLVISAPGGDRAGWGFATLPGTPTNDIAHSVGRPSAVVLPVVPGVSVPTPLPACGAARGEPCRTYVAPKN